MLDRQKPGRRCCSIALLTTFLAGTLSGCMDGLTGISLESQQRRNATAVQLPGIETTACQNGGEYPDCKDPLDPGGDPMAEAPAPPPPGTATGGSGGDGTTSDPFAAGLGAWIGCTAAGLTLVGGALISYATWEQYYDALVGYNSAVLRYQYNGRTSEYYEAMQLAERRLNEQTTMLAGAAGVTVGGFLGVVAACSPTVALPTP